MLVLFAAGFIAWLGALTRINAMARAPLWTAPLHIVGAWLIGDILAEAARDVRSRTPTLWGGREYGLRAES